MDQKHLNNVRANQKFFDEAGTDMNDIEKFFEAAGARLSEVKKPAKKVIAVAFAFYVVSRAFLLAGVLGFIALAAYIVKLVLA